MADFIRERTSWLAIYFSSQFCGAAKLEEFHEDIVSRPELPLLKISPILGATFCITFLYFRGIQAAFSPDY